MAKVNAASAFGKDTEAREKNTSGKLDQPKRQNPEDMVKDKTQLAKEARKFRGKRNSIGAKMAGFRGGEKDFRRSGGGIGDRDLSGKSKTMQHARGGYIPTQEEVPQRSSTPQRGRGRGGSRPGSRAERLGESPSEGGFPE